MNRLFEGDKEMRMNQIATLYFNLRKEKIRTYYLSDGSDNQEGEMIERIENSYQLLEPFEKQIINNDFFYNDYPGWWKYECSENEYLKRRKKAITHFLRNFDNYD